MTKQYDACRWPVAVRAGSCSRYGRRVQWRRAGWDSLGVPAVYPLTARSRETQLRLRFREPVTGYGRLMSEMPDLGPVASG